MLEKHHLDYFNLGKKENEKFWRRLDEKPDFKGKTVLDFGCGPGTLHKYIKFKDLYTYDKFFINSQE